MPMIAEECTGDIDNWKVLSTEMIMFARIHGDQLNSARHVCEGRKKMDYYDEFLADLKELKEAGFIAHLTQDGRIRVISPEGLMLCPINAVKILSDARSTRLTDNLYYSIINAADDRQTPLWYLRKQLKTALGLQAQDR